MTDVAEFYTKQSERFGPSGVLPHHLVRAKRLQRIVGDPPAKILELGAGAGGTARATSDAGYAVTAVELSPLRARYALELARGTGLDVREGDFYREDLGAGFDAVAYWNGFGMGDDEDQRRLLRRVRDEWLRDGGLMLLDIFNPAWWARQPSELRTHDEYAAAQRTTFDDLACRFVDRWWPLDQEDEVIEQSIRCYSPADLRLLVESTGLRVERIEVDDSDDLSRLDDHYSYLAVLRRA